MISPVGYPFKIAQTCSVPHYFEGGIYWGVKGAEVNYNAIFSVTGFNLVNLPEDGNKPIALGTSGEIISPRKLIFGCFAEAPMPPTIASNNMWFDLRFESMDLAAWTKLADDDKDKLITKIMDSVLTSTSKCDAQRVHA